MAFSYDLNTTTGQIRLHLTDTVRDSGPRPGKANFSDEEVSHFYTRGATVNGAVIEGLTVLATEWASYHTMHREADVTIDAKGKAEAYRKQADYLRKNPIGSGPTYGIVHLQRKDAYSEA